MAIDLSRSAITVALGTRTVDPNASFEAGAIVAIQADGTIIESDGEAAFGVAKWNKALTQNGVIADEPVVLEGTTVTALKHGNIVAASVKVANAAGTPYTVTTDYVIDSAANGTLHRVALGGIADGETVYVSYSYQLSEYELKTLRGTNYMNLVDDTQGSGKMTVIQNFAELYTDQYDPSQVYTVGAQLYVGESPMQGKFTPDNGSGNAYGKVYKAPTASDPYLGVILGQ